MVADRLADWLASWLVSLIDQGGGVLTLCNLTTCNTFHVQRFPDENQSLNESCQQEIADGNRLLDSALFAWCQSSSAEPFLHESLPISEEPPVGWLVDCLPACLPACRSARGVGLDRKPATEYRSHFRQRGNLSGLAHPTRSLRTISEKRHGTGLSLIRANPSIALKAVRWLFY